MTDTAKGRRRSVWFGDALWAAVVEAAAHETLRTGEQVSVAEWVRKSVEERLAQDEDAA